MNKEYITETALKGEYRGKPQTCMGTGACQDPSCRDVLTYYFSADRELITSISYTITETSCFPSKACAETAAALGKTCTGSLHHRQQCHCNGSWRAGTGIHALRHDGGTGP